jgi:hypothetical protein
MDRWNRDRSGIIERHRFFSPLHGALGRVAMTDFQWLSPDKLVQKTVFADGTEIFANFGNEPFRVEETGVEVAPESVVAKDAAGKVTRYVPKFD